VATAPAAERGAIPATPEPLIPSSFALAIPDPAPLRHELARGAVAYVMPDPSVPMVEVVVVLTAGEDLDPPGGRGTAGLTAAMLRRGGAGERDPAAFDLEVDRLAAELDSFSGAHRAGAVLDVAAWHLDEGLDLLFDMLARPRFDRERLAMVRESLADGLVAGESDPAVVGSRAWESATARPGETMAAPLRPEGLRALAVEDLVAFHRRHWRPERLVFAVSGAVEPEPRMPELDRDDRVARGAAPSPRFRAVDLSTAGAVVVAGHRLEAAGARPAADGYAALVLEELVAGGSVNRFVGRLRTDLGLVYGIDAELDLAPRRSGRWLALFHCAAPVVGKALEAWLEEVARLRSEPVPDAIVEAARRSILGRLRARFDTASGVAGTFAEDELVGRDHGFWLRMAAGLREVTGTRVRAAARELLRPEDLTVIVVGPDADVRRSLAAAALPDAWRRGGE
jgi:zinc protease